MSATQTIEQLRQAQKAATLLPDRKKAEAEYDRIEGEIRKARRAAAFNATQAERLAEEAREQADRDLRARNAATFETAGSVTEMALKRTAKVADLTRELGGLLDEQRTAIMGLNGTMQAVDPQEDYSRHLTDWFNGALLLFEHHNLRGSGHAAREEPIQPMVDALNRLESRIKFVRGRAKLPL